MRVRALDGRGRLRYAWPARLVAHEGEEFVLCGDWERPLLLPDGRTVPVTNRSLEFYHRRKPYTVAALFDRAWTLQEYYARLVRPPRWDPSSEELVLELLGLDVSVGPNYEYGLIEHEGLPPERAPEAEAEDEEELRRGVFALLEELERREGPFDPETLRTWVERARRM